MRGSLGNSILIVIGLMLGYPSFTTAQERTAQDRQHLLTGVWSLNPEESDDTEDLEREALESLPRPPGQRGVLLGGRPAARDRTIGVTSGFGVPRGFDPELIRDAVAEVSNAAERMVVSFKGDTLLLGLDRDVPRVFVINDKKSKRSWIDGTEVEIKASWRDRKLRIERKHENDLEITQTFTLDRESGRLTVTVEVDGPMPRKIEVTHVYDRVSETMP